MTEHDIDRMMQCVTCVHNPETCGCDDADEDKSGMCMKWTRRGKKNGTSENAGS